MGPCVLLAHALWVSPAEGVGRFVVVKLLFVQLPTPPRSAVVLAVTWCVQLWQWCKCPSLRVVVAFKHPGGGVLQGVYAWFVVTVATARSGTCKCISSRFWRGLQGWIEWVVMLKGLLSARASWLCVDWRHLSVSCSNSCIWDMLSQHIHKLCICFLASRCCLERLDSIPYAVSDPVAASVLTSQVCLGASSAGGVFSADGLA
jgi:hypothetical protein